MKKLVAFALCAAALLGAPAASAAVVTFATRAAFEAAIGGSNGGETFNGFLADATFQNATVAANNMQITGAPGANAAATNKIDAPPLAFAGGYSFDGTSELLGDLSGSQKIRIDFLAAVSAWGADFVGFADGARNTQIQFYTAGDVLVGAIMGAASAANSKEFYGIGFDTPAAYALVGFNTSGIDVFAMDNVAFKTAPPAVPLPGALPLFAAGLLGLGFARRRKAAPRR